MKSCVVYLLKSLKDNNKYIGSTINLKKRLKQHNSGEVRSTKNRRPLICIGYQICSNIQEAAKLEKIYKKSSGALKRTIKNKKFIIIKRGMV